MGNCTGFCVGNTEDKKQQISAEAVSTVLKDRDYLYQDSSLQQTSGLRSLNKHERISKEPITMPNGAVYTGEWIGDKKDG